MQDEVLTAPTFGCPGDAGDLQTARSGVSDSATSEETSAEIPFGTMVIQGADDNGALQLHTSSASMATKLLGISLRSHDFAIGTELGPNGGLKPGATFGVGKRGRWKVLVEDAVTPASDVRVRAVVGGSNGYGAAGAETKGAFRAAADSTDCVDISAFAKWRTSADAGEVAIVEIDMANAALATADA